MFRFRSDLCYLLLSAVFLTITGWAQPPGHGAHPPRPDQPLYLYCQIEIGKEIVETEVPLQLTSSLQQARLDQVVKVAPSVPPLHLKEYLPRAALDQHAIAVTGPDAGRAIQVSIDGPTQSFQRWLVANDEARNRLISLIGTWRYMAVDSPRQREDLFEQFKNELTREPRLLVERTDTGRSAEVPATAGTVWQLADLGCKVSVQTFLPDFAMDTKTGKPTKNSDKRVNPAALVDIEYKDKHEQRWAFAKFPGFRAGLEESLPFRVTLDCPLEKQSRTPDYLLMTVGHDAHEVWTREDDNTAVKRVSIDEKVPIAHSQYTFKIASYLPSARLAEEYRPSEDHSAVAALRVETTDSKGDPTVVWLEFGKQRLIPTEQGPMTAVFGPHRPRAARTHP